jgi:predicted aldo/keto reductase-like oxidoreductase
VASGTLSQGNLVHGLPPELKRLLGAETDAAAAIQFVRSATNLTTALVGMGDPEHVRENLRVAAIKPMEQHSWESMFSRK